MSWLKQNPGADTMRRHSAYKFVPMGSWGFPAEASCKGLVRRDTAALVTTGSQMRTGGARLIILALWEQRIST